MDSVNLLKVGGDGLQLDPKPPVAGDREAILSHHSHQSTSIVLEDLQNSNKIRKQKLGKVTTQMRDCKYLPTFREDYKCKQ